MVDIAFRVTQSTAPEPQIRRVSTDDGHDATSRRLLNEIDDLTRLEQEKRHTARSSEPFHELAEAVNAHARHVFEVARDELRGGAHDSPIPAEREEQHPGDWTEGNRN
jgi:hypothetical protein